MRVLLDEHLDRKLKWRFDAGVDVVTVAERDWKGSKNGELLRLAQGEFDVFVTMDRNIEHQQKIKSLSLGIVILSAPTNRFRDVAPLIPTVNEVLKTIQPGEIIHVTG